MYDPLIYEDYEALDPTALYNKIREELCLLPTLDKKDQGYPHVHFGHLLAGYYAYLKFACLDVPSFFFFTLRVYPFVFSKP